MEDKELEKKIDELFAQHISKNLYPNDLIEFANAIESLVQQECKKARKEALEKVFDNPEWQDKKVGEVPSYAILDFISEQLEELSE